MDTNEQNGIQDIGGLIRDSGYEKPSPEFTDRVLFRIGLESNSQRLVYSPLIPFRIWVVIVPALFTMVMALFLGYLPADITWLSENVVDFGLLIPNWPTFDEIELTNPIVYGTLALLFFVYLQVLLIKSSLAGPFRSLVQ